MPGAQDGGAGRGGAGRGVVSRRRRRCLHTKVVAGERAAQAGRGSAASCRGTGTQRRRGRRPKLHTASQSARSFWWGAGSAEAPSQQPAQQAAQGHPPHRPPPSPCAQGAHLWQHEPLIAVRLVHPAGLGRAASRGVRVHSLDQGCGALARGPHAGPLRRPPARTRGLCEAALRATRPCLKERSTICSVGTFVACSREQQQRLRDPTAGGGMEDGRGGVRLCGEGRAEGFKVFACGAATSLRHWGATLLSPAGCARPVARATQAEEDRFGLGKAWRVVPSAYIARTCFHCTLFGRDQPKLCNPRQEQHSGRPCRHNLRHHSRWFWLCQCNAVMGWDVGQSASHQVHRH